MGLFQQKGKYDNMERFPQSNGSSVMKSIGIVFGVLLVLFQALDKYENGVYNVNDNSGSGI